MSDSSHHLLRPGWVHHLVPAVLAVFVVFFLGSLTVPPIKAVQFSWSDKVGHFFAFGFVAFTHIRAIRFAQFPHRKKAQLVWGALSGSFFGGLLELWQGLLPHRTAEWADFAADTFGAIVVGGLLLVFDKRRA